MELFSRLKIVRTIFSLGAIVIVLFYSPFTFAKCQDLPLDTDPLFRGHDFSANSRYLFALNEGRICIRRRGIPSAKWHRLKMPDKTKGTISEIAVDGSRLVAKGSDNTIYLMKEGIKEPSSFVWMKTWGFPVGRGDALKLPADTSVWDFSYLSAEIDKSFIDSVGQSHWVGVGVGSLFAVRGDQQKINYFDPWLPVDDSYQVCGPHRGRLRIIAISSIGSTMMVMDKFGNIFIRRFDFDIAGCDTVIMNYTYKNRRPHRGILHWLLSERKLPETDWIPLPKVAGELTNKISIDRIGRGAKVRIMRVEGRKDGHTGYYEMEYDFVARSPELLQDVSPLEWKFIETNLPLQGEIIDNSPKLDLGESRGEKFSFASNDYLFPLHVELLDFNRHCSPATMRVTFGKDDSLDLILHVTDKVRLKARKSESKSIKQNGVLEIPFSLLNNLAQQGPRQQRFIKEILGRKQFTKLKLKIKKDKIFFTSDNALNKWEFTKVP